MSSLTVIFKSKKLLDIHAMMKRLVRAVEAIPLHLTVAIVRLDDALGESWALPYQACQTSEVCMSARSLRWLLSNSNRPSQIY